MTNVADNATLEIAGPISMSTAVIGGKTFLFVAGFNDNGASVFRVDTTGLAINGTGGADVINALSSAPGQLLPSELGDKINGFGGNDTLAGLGGNDVIAGGGGRDIQFGGLGADRFDFNVASESKKGSQRDKLQDFQRGLDDIDLRGIDAKGGVSGNNAFKFIGKQDFHAVRGELRYEDKGSTVIVQGDRNGDGKADFEIFVNVGALAKGDFLL
jgi:Ca2+-binding RTX toxin-like protein